MLSFALTLALAAQGTGNGATPTYTVLITVDNDEETLLNGNGLVEAGLLRQDEIGYFVPAPKAIYSAGPYCTMSTQWAYLGDADNDGRYADDSVEAPGDRVDALLVKNSVIPGNGRDVFISKETAEGFSTAVEDGDVFRFAGPSGALEFFVKEDQLLVAIGQLATADLDLDAIAQSATGDLFLSFADAETVGGVSADDGALIYIPASAITYDGAGNITTITASSAVIAATEAQMAAFVTASGMRTSVGGTPSYTELTALEIDPNGGTFTPPNAPSLTLPNLLFCWNGFSNDGAILSTALGGSIASINGVQMASSVATTGLQVGLLPDSTGIFGLDGLALVPAVLQPLTVENYPRNLITSLPSWHRIEISGAPAFSTLFVLGDQGPVGSGSALPSIMVPPFGELFVGVTGGGVLLGNTFSDSDGFADLQLLLTDPVLVGKNFVFQVFDATLLKLSDPAALQLL